MSRVVASALAVLVLASNLVGGICWWCHGDGQAHDEPCCDQPRDAAPVVGEAGCCEQLDQWRLTQAVERVEVQRAQQVVLAVLVLSAIAPPAVAPETFDRTWSERPDPGGGALLRQHRSLLI